MPGNNKQVLGVLFQKVVMNWILVLAIALSFLTGVSLTYLLLKQQINQQKETQTAQIQKTIEQLEKAHESRMQTTINSLRQHYDSQLNQATELLQKEIALTPPKSPPNPQSLHQKSAPTYAPQYSQP